jgi:hypothetical protein
MPFTQAEFELDFAIGSALEENSLVRFNDLLARASTVFELDGCTDYEFLEVPGFLLAVTVLLSTVAPRFRERPGGYTRIVKLAKPRLGDAGPRAILEFVGVRDRQVQRAEKPTFSDEATETAKA